MIKGIGPQNLGSQGMNPKSTPCGHARSPLDFNEKLRAAEAAGQLPDSFASAVRSDGDSPMNYQGDIDNIQAAADTLSKHNISGGESGGGSAASPAAPATQLENFFTKTQASLASAVNNQSRGTASAPSAGGFTQAVVNPAKPEPIPSAAPRGSSNAILGPASDRIISQDYDRRQSLPLEGPDFSRMGSGSYFYK
jgi:hypothetical protein